MHSLLHRDGRQVNGTLVPEAVPHEGFRVSRFEEVFDLGGNVAEWTSC